MDRSNIQHKYNHFLRNALFKYKFCKRDIFLKIYKRVPKQRDATFSYCIDFLINRPNIQIAELGTSRSFVDGKIKEGVCINDTIYWKPESPDKWDWSAGLFSRYFSEVLKSRGKDDFKITSIDICEKAIAISKKINENFIDHIEYKTCTSEEYIRNQPRKSLDLLYLDTGDMNEKTAQLHKREAELLIKYQIIKDDGIILIDDVRNPSMILNHKEQSKYGKSKYSIPLLFNNGYTIIIDEYQMILKKKINYHKALEKVKKKDKKRFGKLKQIN
jgi:hypothetical protein